jgi:hypothetical protein
MTSTVIISCLVDTTDASVPLGFEAWVDDHKIFDTDHVQGPQQISTEISDDDDLAHELRLVMKNKTEEHTEVNDLGDIVRDARLVISELCFDGIKLGNIVAEKAVYEHDFNGSMEKSLHEFFGEMGCNGTVKIEFTTPVYMWMLEHI